MKEDGTIPAAILEFGSECQRDLESYTDYLVLGWVDCASLNFRYLRLYSNSELAFVHRNERRLSRTKNGVVNKSGWTGTVSIPMQRYQNIIDEFVHLGAFELSDFFPVDDYLDGECYVVIAMRAGKKQLAYIETPALSESRSMRNLFKKVDVLMNRPRKFFEK